MTKYPGSQILYEIGTRTDLAKSYGVSERTIYRWLAKAAKESGITPELKTKYPGAKKIEKFKGTRKQLAMRYGVSERTAYRWINKARAEGAAPESRLPKSKYPGAHILLEDGTNKEIAERYNVSTRTIQRWMKKAEKEVSEEPKTPDQKKAEEFDEEEWKATQEEITTPDDEQQKFEDEFFQEEANKEEIDEKEQVLEQIGQILLDNPFLVSESSIFRDLLPEEQTQYLDAYIQYQYDLDEHQFYDPETHTMSFDPDFVSNINIWGDEFEEWVNKQFSSDMYEVPY